MTHNDASVTVNVYTPAHKLVMFAEVEENPEGPDQLITYGGTPPLGFAFAEPLHVPLQVALVNVGLTVNVGGAVI